MDFCSSGLIFEVLCEISAATLKNICEIQVYCIATYSSSGHVALRLNWSPDTSLLLNTEHLKRELQGCEVYSDPGTSLWNRLWPCDPWHLHNPRSSPGTNQVQPASGLWHYDTDRTQMSCSKQTLGWERRGACEIVHLHRQTHMCPISHIHMCWIRANVDMKSHLNVKKWSIFMVHRGVELSFLFTDHCKSDLGYSLWKRHRQRSFRR